MNAVPRGRGTFDPALPAVPQHLPLDDRQADTTRFDDVTACQGLEDRKDTVVQPRRDAGPVIAGAELRDTVRHPHRDRDAARGTIVMFLQRPRCDRPRRTVDDAERAQRIPPPGSTSGHPA
jgi:hypothetical protein